MLKQYKKIYSNTHVNVTPKSSLQKQKAQLKNSKHRYKVSEAIIEVSLVYDKNTLSG